MRNLAARAPGKLARFAAEGEVISPFDLTPGFYRKGDPDKGVDVFLETTRLKAFSATQPSADGFELEGKSRQIPSTSVGTKQKLGR